MPESISASRRRFLRQSLAWSALASVSPLALAKKEFVADHDAVHALIIGDWGWMAKPSKDDLRAGDSYAAQSQVAQGMQRYASRHSLRTEALFLLGDNWYGDLSDGAKSQRWVDQFEKMYPAESFSGPAYAMLGNHDYQTIPSTVNKVQAELEYAKSGHGLDGKATRWTMPGRWYTFDFPQHNPLMHCIVLDSNMPAADGRWQHNENFTLKPEEQAEQLTWFEDQLKKPRTAPFLVVMAHHPVYSNGPHGDHPVLSREWSPLFQKYKVDLYMAGHDHDMQVLHFEDQPTTHILSGGGGADLYVLKIDDAARGPYAQEVHGFSHLSVSRRELQVRHLDAGGRFLFGIAKTPEGNLRMLDA